MPLKLGGLETSNEQLRILACNIVNTRVGGHTTLRTEFRDAFAAGALGANSSTIGTGIHLRDVSQQFTPDTEDYYKDRQGHSIYKAKHDNSVPGNFLSHFMPYLTYGSHNKYGYSAGYLSLYHNTFKLQFYAEQLYIIRYLDAHEFIAKLINFIVEPGNIDKDHKLYPFVRNINTIQPYSLAVENILRYAFENASVDIIAFKNIVRFFIQEKDMLFNIFVANADASAKCKEKAKSEESFEKLYTLVEVLFNYKIRKNIIPECLYDIQEKLDQSDANSIKQDMPLFEKIKSRYANRDMAKKFLHGYQRTVDEKLNVPNDLQNMIIAHAALDFKFS